LATGLYNEALGQFTRRDYQAALKLTEQIININRRVQDPVLDRAKSLYIRIKSRLQTDTVRAPDLKLDQIVKMTKFYRDGLDAYQKGNFQRAVDFAKRALQIDPNYTSAQSLLDSATKRMK
jgi:tetratricopeptide (TPR) repeat protein